MKIVQIGQPVLTDRRVIQAVSADGIAVSFPEPQALRFSLDQTLSIDLEAPDLEQMATNLTTGEDFKVTIAQRDMHDMRLPAGHGTTRFPSLSRRQGG